MVIPIYATVVPMGKSAKLVVVVAYRGHSWVRLFFPIRLQSTKMREVGAGGLTLGVFENPCGSLLFYKHKYVAYRETERQTDTEKEEIRVTLHRRTMFLPEGIGYQTKSPMPGMGYPFHLSY